MRFNRKIIFVSLITIGLVCIYCNLKKVSSILLLFASFSSSFALNPVISFRDERFPLIYMITPTYTRVMQKAELTRLAQTLKHISNFHWIVVENEHYVSKLVYRLLLRSGINYTLLFAPKSKQLSNLTKSVPRAVESRNRALRYLRELYQNSDNSSRPCPDIIVYFGDDDNTYDLRLFELMRQIKVMGTWPVGLTGGLMVEKPLIQNGQIIGWDVQYQRKRKYAVDMAGFAIHLQVLLTRSDAWFLFKHPPETHFLAQLAIPLKNIQPLGMQLGEVLVWHTKTAHPNLQQELTYQNRTGLRSNDGFEV